MIKYDIHFKTNNGNKYSITVNGRTKMQTLLYGYEDKMGIYSFGIQYWYNGKKIENYYNTSLLVADFFKNEKIPTIFVNDEQNKIGKLINVTFKISNGDKYTLIFNSKSKVERIKKIF